MPAKRTAPKKTAAKKTTRKTTRKRRGPAEPRGPEPAQTAIAADDPDIGELVGKIRASRGEVIGAYRDPYAGTPLVFASLPIGSVEATPFQRDLSRTHAERLATAIGDTGAFLDPVIAIPAKEGFLSPNGRHRIAAARQLGQRSITVLATGDPALAYRILALNTEKAHNLRDRSLEVIRMARALAKEQPRSKEKDHATSFESPAFLTLGCAYDKRDRFSGSSYNSMLRRVEVFLDQTLPVALRQREQWAVRLLDIDDRVTAHVKALQEMGMKSPYLRAVVVARCNPVRWIPSKKGEGPPMSVAEALTRMTKNVRAFEPKKVRPQDLAFAAAVGGGGEET
ncbi:MAG TPA: chromosome partitioning protein ParB [Candidatus Limnocylindria bacterium]|jgi:ParB family chromosome partitioning protein|nr:chromosome partitioning protein ParB [Candidatus Limnocylindria bacterium]